MNTLENSNLHGEKWRLQGYVFFSFIIWLKHIYCGCLLELHHWDSSNEHLQLMFEQKENVNDYELKNDTPRAMKDIIN